MQLGRMNDYLNKLWTYMISLLFDLHLFPILNYAHFRKLFSSMPSFQNCGDQELGSYPCLSQNLHSTYCLNFVIRVYQRQRRCLTLLLNLTPRYATSYNSSRNPRCITCVTCEGSSKRYPCSCSSLQTTLLTLAAAATRIAGRACEDIIERAIHTIYAAMAPTGIYSRLKAYYTGEKGQYYFFPLLQIPWSGLFLEQGPVKCFAGVSALLTKHCRKGSACYQYCHCGVLAGMFPLAREVCRSLC